MKKAIFKFNGGIGALLCSNCSVVMKVGHQFTKLERLAMMGKKKLEPQYCEKCLSEKEVKDYDK
jgi:hypothetical protein